MVGVAGGSSAAAGGGTGGGGGGSVDMTGYATEEWVNENYLSIEFFSSLFKAYDSAATPNEIAPNDGDTTAITNIKAMFGFWTEQYLSALGLNSAGGGGGATSLADLLDVDITSPTNGQALVYNATSGKWENQTIGGGSTGTLSSIGLVMPAGFSVSPATLTADGSFTVSFDTGYALPLVADVNKGVTAYGWGNHANAGYLTSVAFADLTSHPTTLAGYGITDAKIASGTITLGSNTITPWTPSNHPTTLSGYAINDAYINNGSIVLGTNSITPWTTNNHPTTLAGYGVSDANFGTAVNNYVPITLGSITQNVLLSNALNGYATQSWVGNNYLPLTGGTLTGDLRLKDSTNYGRSIYFGDADYCYLNEDYDDHLRIYAGEGVSIITDEDTFLWNGSVVATVASNVASATKLQTARKLWGNDFDGTADVTGAIYMLNGTGNGILIKDSGGTERNALGMDATAGASALHIGLGMRGYGQTVVNGNEISFTTGASNAGVLAAFFGTTGILHLKRELYLDTNNKGISMMNNANTMVTSLSIDSSNNLIVGEGAYTVAGINLYFRGKTINFQTNDGGGRAGDKHVAYFNEDGDLIFRQPGRTIYMLDSVSTNRSMVSMNPNNILIFGYGSVAPDYATQLRGGTTQGIGLYCGDTHVAHIYKDANRQGIRIGDGLLTWNSTWGGFEIMKYDGTAAHIVATGGVSALGFAPIINSLDAFTITNLTTSTVTSTNWNITSDGNAKFKKVYLDDARYFFIDTTDSNKLKFYDGTQNKTVYVY